MKTYYRVKVWGVTVGGGWSTVYFKSRESLLEAFPYVKASQIEVLHRLPRRDIQVNA